MMLKRDLITLTIGVCLIGCIEKKHDVGIPAREPNESPHESVKTHSDAVTEFTDPVDVIRPGTLKVDVMELAAAPRLTELGKRLKNAVRGNPDWFVELLDQTEPGEPIPYDARMGISRADYEDFLAFKMTAQKRSTATLTIRSRDKDSLVFDGGQDLADLTDIAIDLKNDVVQTPFGVLTKRGEINAPEDSALGAWVGTEWRLEKDEPSRVIVASLSVGKLTQSGRGVLYYDVKQLKPNGTKSRISHILNFDSR